MVRRSELARLAGVPPATIKHYVQVGLLPQPSVRPNGHISYFPASLVDRIRAIKILQSERFLPLEQIGAVLGPVTDGGGEALEARQLATLEPALTPPSSEFVAGGRCTAVLQITADELDLLEHAGLLTATHQKGVRGYRGPSLELLRVIHAARLAGLGDLFTPAVLAPYVDAVRKLVALELDLFRARLASSAARPDAPLPKLARRTDALGERLLVVLRRQLLLAAVRSAPVSPARLPRRPRQK